MSRHMTADGKRQELAGWEAAKADRAARPPDGWTGGTGWPDPEIYGWVDRLNALSRVCTLQSCAGHVCTLASHCRSCEVEAERVGIELREQLDDAPHVWNGQLWLWLDEALARYAYGHAPLLAAMPGIEKVGIMWHVDGREILDVQFLGDGHGTLDASMAQVLAFLQEGNRQCNLGAE